MYLYCSMDSLLLLWFEIGGLIREELLWVWCVQDGCLSVYCVCVSRFMIERNRGLLRFDCVYEVWVCVREQGCVCIYVYQLCVWMCVCAGSWCLVL